MLFREIKKKLVEILKIASSGRFQTVGYQYQGIDAAQIVDSNRMVQIYYDSGKFPKSASSINGPFQHDMTFNVNMLVSKAAEGDLAPLLDESSTPAERATALENFKNAALLVDESFDELAEIIWQILTDGENYNLNLSKGSIANRWIENIQKNDPLGLGDFVVLTGFMSLKCRAEEEVLGIIGLAGTDADNLIDIYSKDEIKDDVQKTGVEGKFPT